MPSTRKPLRRARSLRGLVRPGGAAAIILVGALLAGVSGCDVVYSDGTTSSAPGSGGASATPTTSPTATLSTPPTSPTPAATGTALALLATLPVKGRAPMTGYVRTTVFGTAWFDVDRNGCDTRDDILARDLTKITRSGPCRVLSGDLVSPYTLGTIHFVRGVATSTLVQIDHMVSLGDAWQTGAQQLTQAQRVSLANDPLNLMAVDGRSNEQKGDGDAATWLPANKAFRCAYVARQISVKAAYRLWVTQPEHDAMTRILASCPTQPALSTAAASGSQK